jgi:hypothetical protein
MGWNQEQLVRVVEVDQEFRAETSHTKALLLEEATSGDGVTKDKNTNDKGYRIDEL